MNIFSIFRQGEKANNCNINEINTLSENKHTNNSIFNYSVEDDESFCFSERQGELPSLAQEDDEIFSELPFAYAPAKKKSNKQTKKTVKKNVSTKKTSPKKTVKKPVKKDVKNTQKNSPKCNKKINLGINRKIDERVIQGGTGDCWLISAVMALNATEKGREIIKNAIRPNDDGSVTVNFAGIDEEMNYTIAPEEIKKYDTDDELFDEYSNGDNDMLVLELAMEKLRLDAGTGENLDGGNEHEVFFALAPSCKITVLRDNELTENNLENFLKKAANSKNTAICCNIKVFKGTGIMVPKGFTNSEIGIHAYAITKITDKDVTLVDPHNTSEALKMSIDDLKYADATAFYAVSL